MNNDKSKVKEKYLLFCPIDNLFQTIIAMKTQLGSEKNINKYLYDKTSKKQNKCNKKNINNEIIRKEDSDLDFSRSIHHNLSNPSMSSENDNALNIERQKIENKIKDNILILKDSKAIDKDVYSFKYFIQLKVLLFAAATITNSFLFVFLLCLSPPKNNIYCFNQITKEFEKCPQNDIYKCANGINEHIYNNKIYDDDELTELLTINQYYLNFYHRDFSTFVYLNSIINTKDPLSYSIRISLTKNEEFTLRNLFRFQCNNETFSMLVTVIVGLISGNIFFGYCADVFGRKIVLVITLIIQGLGGVIIVMTCFIIQSKGVSDKSTSYNNNYKMFKFNHTNYPIINNYLESKSFTNLIGFEKTNLSTHYNDNYDLIKTEVLESNFIYKSFQKYHFLLLFGLVVISFGNSINYFIIRAYLLEYSLCEDYYFSDCVQIHLTEPLALIASYAIVLFIRSFPVSLIIISILSFIFAILIYLLFFESLRFYFEYSRFDLITNAVKKILNNHSNFFNPTKGRRLSFIQNIQKENKEEYDTMIENSEVLFWKNFFFSQSIHQIHIEKFKKKNRLLIKKQYLYSYPRLIMTLLYLNPTIQNEFLTTLSFITITGCVHYISLCKVTSSLLISRTTIHHNYFFNLLPLYISIIYSFSLSCFSIILKVLNIHYAFLISFIGTLIFSLSFELVALFPEKINDLNLHHYSSHQLLYDKHHTTLIALFFCQLFFVLSIKFACFYYMTKLTKTVYRCTVYGLWNCLFYLAMLLAVGMDSQFDTNLLYVALFSMLGLISLYFISKNTGVGITTDLHEIKKNETNNYKKMKTN